MGPTKFRWLTRIADYQKKTGSRCSNDAKKHHFTFQFRFSIKPVNSLVFDANRAVDYYKTTHAYAHTCMHCIFHGTAARFPSSNLIPRLDHALRFWQAPTHYYRASGHSQRSMRWLWFGDGGIGSYVPGRFPKWGGCP